MCGRRLGVFEKGGEDRIISRLSNRGNVGLKERQFGKTEYREG